MKSVKRLFNSFFNTNKSLPLQLESILGFRPKYLPYYQTALTHSSLNEELHANNERLEFLGDAVLGIVIAEYLFKKFPKKDEGFLTELRSKLVRRETLNDVANRIGLNKLVEYNHKDRGLPSSHIFGNALEALIGAIYLDQGLTKAKFFITTRMVKPYLDIDKIAVTDNNYKNQLLTWSQKEKQSISFDHITEVEINGRKAFKVSLFLNDECIGEGTAYNKKEASQVASKAALEFLKLL
jgi:ribonuclease-3